MLVIFDLEAALRDAPYRVLLEMFEAALVTWYMASDPKEREGLGKIVIAIATAASQRDEHRPSDLMARDAEVRNCVLRHSLGQPPMAFGQA